MSDLVDDVANDTESHGNGYEGRNVRLRFWFIKETGDRGLHTAFRKRSPERLESLNRPRSSVVHIPEASGTCTEEAVQKHYTITQARAHTINAPTIAAMCT